MKTKAPQTTTVPEKARRQFVASLRKLAGGKRFTQAERTELARMADAWEATLPKRIS